MGDMDASRTLLEMDVLLCDRDAFRQQKHTSDNPSSQQKLKKRLMRSKQILASRQKQELIYNFPENLPVSAALSQLSESIAEHQVTIVCGGTGSGKSTQIPKLLLQMGFGLHGQIAHTQPRRIAARALAQRIASETGSQLGSAIGSQVRFDKRVSDSTRLKLMTDGILLEEIRNDKLLKNYDAIIIDEVHERSSNIDFALGYIAKILPKRPELKLVLMSASVDNQALMSIFEANLVDVQGKQFPIVFDYRPIDPEEQSDAQAIDAAINELNDSEDVLVFLPGEREINEIERYLRGKAYPNTEILPLFSRLNASAQAKIFELSTQRRIILATNVAETSITIPGIRHVIDTGLARTSRYNPRSKLLELPIAEISQAAAKQRAGRCGREAPGRCIRLYAEENYEQREQFSKPEILRTNLASAILRCEALKLGELARFPLPDKPSPKLISDGINLLKEITALDRNNRITPLGKQISRLSADPRLARFLIAAGSVGQLADALTISAALTAGDCRLKPVDKREAADLAHEEFAHKDSDLLFFVNLWQHINDGFDSLSVGQKRKYCERKFLSWQRVQQWRDMRGQLEQQCRRLSLESAPAPPNYKKLHSAFITAFASLVGVKNRAGDYSGARGITFKIHPRSALIGKKPKFIVCLEMFETSARYAQVVAKIDAAWVQKAAPHLIKYSYSAPSWDKKTGRAVAMETQRIFGVKLGSDKKVSYVPIDAIHSRALFIRHGLVNGDLPKPVACVRHNRDYLKRLKKLEHKFRRAIAPDEDDLFEHYSSVLPDNVVTHKGYERWCGENPEHEKQMIFAADSELRDLQRRAKHEYPNRIRIGEFLFRANYLFDPMNPADGITFAIHENLLTRLKPDALDTLCPGLLLQKLTLLAKALPKNNRKKISPIAEFVNGVLALVSQIQAPGQDDKSLPAIFCRYYLEKTGEVLESSVLANAALPDYLEAHVRVICDGQQRSDAHTASAKKKSSQSFRFYRSLANALARETNALHENTHLDAESIHSHWCFGDVPREIPWQVDANTIIDYPGLRDRNVGVQLARFVSAADADFNHLHGVARLASMASGVKAKKRALAGFEQKNILLMCASLDLSAEDVGQIRKAAYAHALLSTTAPRTAGEFDDFLQISAAEVEQQTAKMSLAFAELIPQAYHVKKLLGGELATRWPEPLREVSMQLSELLNGEMLSYSNPEKLSNLPRYLTGIQRRLDRLQLDPNKDKQKMLLLQEPLALWRAVRQRADSEKPKLCELRYDVEELILSQFAPELSVSRKPSLKQVMQQLKKLNSSGDHGT